MTVAVSEIISVGILLDIMEVESVGRRSWVALSNGVSENLCTSTREQAVGWTSSTFK